MAPLWLPQNVQKRVFRYILTRLAVFSNLDLDNLDVSLGGFTSQTQLSLNSVQLDTEKLSVLPGIYVRDGAIDKVDVKLAVLGGVRIEGSGIRLTVSLTKKVLEENEEDIFAALLERTTADLAESIMISQDTHQVDEDLAASLAASMNIGPPGALASSFTSSIHSDGSSSSSTGLGLGYGMGDFSGVVNRVVDAAISQLSVSLSDIKVTLLVDNVTLELSVDSANLSTNSEGVRHVSVSDIECILVNPSSQESDDDFEQDLTVSGPNMFRSTHEGPMEDSMMQSMYHDAEYDTQESNLMQSIMFSREEASSIYMSAMAANSQEDSPSSELPKARIFWCDSLKLNFKGLKMASLGVDIGRVFLSLKHVPAIAIPLLTFFKTHHKAHHADPKNEVLAPALEQEEEGFSLEKAVIERIEINLTSALLSNGLYEDETSIRVILDQLEYSNFNKETETLQISKIAVEGREDSIISFPKGAAKSNDLTYQITNEKAYKVCKLMIPNAGKININADDIFELQDIVRSYEPILEILSSLASPKIESNSAPDMPFQIFGQTSAFELKLRLDASVIRATIFPLSFDKSNTLLCPQVNIYLPKDGNSVLLKSFTMHYASTTTRKLHILSGNINCEIQHLNELIDEFKYLQSEWISTIPIVKKEEPPIDDIQYQRAQHEIRSRPILDEAIFELKVSYLGLQVLFPGALGKIEADLGDLHTVLKKSGKTAIELSTIHVSRDMSDIDPSLGHLSIIHKVSDCKTVSTILHAALGCTANYLDKTITCCQTLFEWYSNVSEPLQPRDRVSC